MCYYFCLFVAIDKFKLKIDESFDGQTIKRGAQAVLIDSQNNKPRNNQQPLHPILPNKNQSHNALAQSHNALASANTDNTFDDDMLQSDLEQELLDNHQTDIGSSSAALHDPSDIASSFCNHFFVFDDQTSVDSE